MIEETVKKIKIQVEVAECSPFICLSQSISIQGNDYLLKLAKERD